MSASYPPGAPFRTGPTHRRGRVSPRVALRACLVALALVLLLVVATACGNAELPKAPPAPPTAPPTTTASPTPTTTAPAPTTTTPTTTGPGTGSPTPSTGGDADAPRGTTAAPRAGGGSGGSGGSGTAHGGTAARTPIWPVTDAAAARNLQKQVDGGREPWLLDPTEVATSYSGVALKYRDPTVVPIRPGVVDVQDGATRNKATITLAQTVRQGDGGIWLVTGVRRR